MQIASFGIWAQLADSISYDDNHFTKYKFLYVVIEILNPKLPLHICDAIQKSCI